MESAEETTVKKMREDFITDQIFSLTLMAITQRSRIYSEKSDKSGEDAREGFRKALRRLLEECAKSYSQKVSPERHWQNIQGLANELSANHETCLRDGIFRIGLAQKALNLYLKYLWCLGRIPEPPHCPIDRMVLTYAKCAHGKNWTDIESNKEYSKAIQCVSEKAAERHLSLARWELEIWAAAKEKS